MAFTSAYALICLLLVNNFLEKGQCSIREVPTMRTYASCTESINRILPKNDCKTEFAASIDCTKELERSIDSCPDGNIFDMDDPCNLMKPFLTVSPMYYNKATGDSKSICKKISQLQTCQPKECPSTLKAEVADNTVGCSVNAVKTCVPTTYDLKNYTKNNCGKFSLKRDCFTTKLKDCRGSDTEQMAADVVLIGFNEHLKRCKEADELCSSVTATIPSMIPSTDSYFTEKTCMEIHKMYDGLKKCFEDNKKKTARSVLVRVTDGIDFLTDPIAKCSKKGFGPKGYVGDGASQINPPLMSVLVLAVVVMLQ